MKTKESLKKCILAATGSQKPELVLKSAQIVNVFTEELECADVAIQDGYVVGIGSYEGEKEIDLSGKIICPGFIDGHIHLESSMVSPQEFEKVVLPHGTTGVITDPHEIANVAGVEGIRYMLAATEGLDLDVYFMMPSCVPATGLDESGAVLLAEQLRPFYTEERVLGLAEMMNAYGTVNADADIIDKIADAQAAGKLVDGHAPGLNGNGLNAYVAAGVQSDHECSTAEEAIEKIRRGQWLMVRDGTAAKNLEALSPMCKPPYAERSMFVTDDKHPGDLIQEGHIDGIVRKAVAMGVDPIIAIKMGSYQTATYFGLKNKGAIAPGYIADIVVLSDLTDIKVEQVFKAGKIVAENGKKCESKNTTNIDPEDYPAVFHSFHISEIKESDLELKESGAKMRVIEMVPHELLTLEKVADWKEVPGYAPGVNVEEDIVKMIVAERHHDSGHIGIGFLKGYGIKAGAVATSVAHDSHNLSVAGVNDGDMALAANIVRKNEGGLAVVKDGEILGELPLPIGGLMSPESVEVVDEKLEEMKKIAGELGISPDIDPFMTLAFASLPVIPQLRLNTFGLINVEKQQVVPVICG